MTAAAAPTLAPFLEALPVDGGSITVVSPSGLSSTVASSDPLAAVLDALQTDLGEGPRWHARRTATPVLLPDADGSRNADWPLFDDARARTPVRGVFAFPLIIGGAVLGVVDLYSLDRGDRWSPTQITLAMRVTTATARPAVRLATRSAGASLPSPSGQVELRREVHQATGILIGALGVSPDDALARLQAYAFAVDRPVLDVARDLIARRLTPQALSG